jgi:hypothetical protein
MRSFFVPLCLPSDEIEMARIPGQPIGSQRSIRDSSSGTRANASPFQPMAARLHDGIRKRELCYQNGDKMMAVDISTGPAFRPSKAHLLFENRQRLTSRTTYVCGFESDRHRSGPVEAKTVTRNFRSFPTCFAGRVSCAGIASVECRGLVNCLCCKLNARHWGYYTR